MEKRFVKRDEETASAVLQVRGPQSIARFGSERDHEPVFVWVNLESPYGTTDSLHPQICINAWEPLVLQ